MPVRHPILNGFGRLGLGEAAAKMIDASVDTIVKEQDESPVEDMRKALEELAERENVPKVYILKEQYEKIDPDIIHQKEAEFHCVLVPVEEHEMKGIIGSLIDKAGVQVRVRATCMSKFTDMLENEGARLTRVGVETKAYIQRKGDSDEETDEPANGGSTNSGDNNGGNNNGGGGDNGSGNDFGS